MNNYFKLLVLLGSSSQNEQTFAFSENAFLLCHPDGKDESIAYSTLFETIEFCGPLVKMNQLDLNLYEKACRGMFHLSLLPGAPLLFHSLAIQMLQDLHIAYGQTRQSIISQITLYIHRAIPFLRLPGKR